METLTKLQKKDITLIGTFVDIRVTSTQPHSLRGELDS